jgi:hypothetical protein
LASERERKGRAPVSVLVLSPEGTVLVLDRSDGPAGRVEDAYRFAEYVYEYDGPGAALPSRKPPPKGQ